MADKREGRKELRGGEAGSPAHPFFALATLALLVAILAAADDVIVPLALAGVIAFALNPAVRLLERYLGRRLAVGIVALTALAAVSGFAYVLKVQLVDLSTQMSRYSESMRRKVKALRMDDKQGLSALSREIDRMLEGFDERVAETRAASPVKIVAPATSAASRVESVLEPILQPAAKTIVVLVLVIFFLFQHEDMRDRFIRLIGRRNLTLTTRTLDEAGHRIGRFLITQSAINAAFGCAVTLGLLAIGIAYAPLWGVVAAVLRFVPFIGTILAIVPPTLLAFVQFEGWGPTLVTMLFFLSLDLLFGYVIEPLAIGRKVGVSSIAMIVMAVFWTWLWGPIGLVLSTPLTVCLTVLGRQVTRLEFLAILLGDEPALEAELAFYQRLLAGDEDEAGEILTRELGTRGTVSVLGEVVVPALLMAERDRAAGRIGDADRDHFLRATQGLLDAVFDPGATPPTSNPLTTFRVLGVPARNAADELLWRVIVRLFDGRPVSHEAAPAAALASEVTMLAERNNPHLICITSVPPGGLAHARYLCKRLRARLPEVPILVVRPNTSDDSEGSYQPAIAGNVSLAATLTQVARRAEDLAPVATA